MQVTREDIIAAIQQAKVVDAPDSLRSDIKLTDQGIDSLGMFNVILVLQEKYAIEIPDPDIDRLNTIDELIAYLNTRVV
jgi:acyl carrier protein